MKTALRSSNRRASGEGDDTELVMSDPRMMWIEARMISWLRIRSVDFRTAIADDDQRIALTSFLDIENEKMLFTSHHPTTGVLFSLLPLSQSLPSRKVTVFMRMSRDKITMENIHLMIAILDVATLPLQGIKTLMEDVQSPLIESFYPTRNATACAGVRRELLTRIRKLCSAVHMKMGEQQNLCNLALPPSELTSRNVSELYLTKCAATNDRVHELELLVQKWSYQCKSVLGEEPTEALAGCMELVAFWDRKVKGLTHMFKQIHSETAESIQYILSFHQSAFTNVLAKMKSDVNTVLEQSMKIIAWLQPLSSVFQRISPTIESSTSVFESVVECQDIMERCLQSVYILWRYSDVYATTTPLTLLLQLICKDLVASSVKFLRLRSLADGATNVSEVMQRLQVVVNVLGDFKFLYFGLRARIGEEEDADLTSTNTPTPTAGASSSSSIRNPHRARSWRVQHEFVFRSLDLYLDRCFDLLSLMEMDNILQRISSVDLGEVLGKDLNVEVHHMHSDFKMKIVSVYELCADGRALDFNDTKTDAKLSELSAVLRDIERSLLSITQRVLTSCRSLGALFRSLDSFDVFLERPRMGNARSQNLELVTGLWCAELRDIMKIFTQFNVHVPECYQTSFPTVSAYVYWCTHLLQRAHEPKSRVAQICGGTVTVESLEVFHLLQEFTKKTVSSCYNLVNQWCAEVPNTISRKMVQHIMTRDDDSMRIVVNDDLTFMQVHQEVTLLKSIQSSASNFFTHPFNIPQEALLCSGQCNAARLRATRLHNISSEYNNVLLALPNHELNLFGEEMDMLDKNLDDGIRKLLWSSDEKIDEFIQFIQADLSLVLKAVHELHYQTKRMQDSLNTLSTTDDFLPLVVERQADKTMNVDEFTAKYEAHRQQGVANIVSSCQLHQEALTVCFDAISALKTKYNFPPVTLTSPTWIGFVNYISESVQEKLIDVAHTPISNMHKQMDRAWLKVHNGVPLLDVKVVLHESHATTSPLMRLAKDHISTPNAPAEVSVDNIIQMYVMNSMNQTSHFTRLDGQGGNYLAEISSAQRLLELRDAIQALFERTEKDIEQFVASYSHFVVELFTNNHYDTLKAKEDSVFKISLAHVDMFVKKYSEMEAEIGDMPTQAVFGCIRLDAKPIRQSLRISAAKMRADLVELIHETILQTLDRMQNIHVRISDGINVSTAEDLDSNGLRVVLHHMRDAKSESLWVFSVLEPLREGISLLQKHKAVSLTEIKRLETLVHVVGPTWEELLRKTMNLREQLASLQDRESTQLKENAMDLELRIQAFKHEFTTCSLFQFGMDTDDAYEMLDSWKTRMKEIEAETRQLIGTQDLFEITPINIKEIEVCKEDLRTLKYVWDMWSFVQSNISVWMDTVFRKANAEDLIDDTKKLRQAMSSLPSKVRSWGCYVGMDQSIKDMLTMLPLMRDLQSPSVKDRHWKALWKEIRLANLAAAPSTTAVDPEASLVVREETKAGEPEDDSDDENFNLWNPMEDTSTLQGFFELQLHNYAQTVLDIVDKANRELQIERTLNKIFAVWETLEFQLVETIDANNQLGEDHAPTKAWLLTSVDEIMEIHAEHVAILQTTQSNRAVEFFSHTVALWIDKLGDVEAIVSLWSTVQRQWLALSPIFRLSDDVRRQLHDLHVAFLEMDGTFLAFQNEACKHRNVLQMCSTDVVMCGLMKMWGTSTLPVTQGKKALEVHLQSIAHVFGQCEHGLLRYLEQKRRIFPRFYFLSTADLLDILAHASDPPKALSHLPKMVEAINSIQFVANSKTRLASITDHSGEIVAFHDHHHLDGLAEQYLHTVINLIQQTLRTSIQEAVNASVETPRLEWIMKFPSQVVMVLTRLVWTLDTTHAFEALEDGNVHAMSELLRQLRTQVASEIELTKRPLTAKDRKMIVTLITIDVHSRDVVQDFVDKKKESAAEFCWQSQLKVYWNETSGCSISICDVIFQHGSEYVGNTGCLVITPLTDRCYITLTQALCMHMGGAAAGPAGTGKTETTKDLARVLGFPCFVFNCSDQMDNISLGGIFKGLAMSGSWGCFDEFNRIAAEVLSVVAMQVRCVLEGSRKNEKTFRFDGEDLTFCKNVGIFITMNPGYLGRTELPENIKTLFRPCAMVEPDIVNICEIMLAAEGFINAKQLAIKLVTLYRFNKEALSMQQHYDWGLRAIKSVLLMAGQHKQRSLATTAEHITMYQALLSANYAKLVKDDQPAFLRMLKSLFGDVILSTESGADDSEFDSHLQTSLSELGLLAGDGTVVTKARQLRETIGVRHSVFVLGGTGTGKSSLWKATVRAMGYMQKEKPLYEIIEPNAISASELYGYTLESTREWRDGILSHIFREFSNASKTKQNWKIIVLDGIIDAGWIESMNTVMDDNKILTLSSNERILLTSTMRLVFEVSHLQHATPATVSRAGILFLNNTDFSWSLCKDRWVSSLRDERERTNFDILCDKYIPLFFDYLAKNGSFVVPTCDIAFVHALQNILDGLRGSAICPVGCGAEVYEKVFLWSCAWAFGSTLTSTGLTSKRVAFTSWYRREFPMMRLQDVGVVFDYMLARNETTFELELVPWSVPKYEGGMFVPCMESSRVDFFLDLLVPRGKCVMLVGPSGVGKSCLLKRWLMKNANSETVTHSITPFTGYTDSLSLQNTLELLLERRSGRTYAPPGRKNLIVFLEDINLQNPDSYGTQSSTSLLRQHLEHGGWYDMEKMSLKDIQNVQYLTTYNPKGGNGAVVDRLQRLFFTIGLHVPVPEDIHPMLSTYLQTVWGEKSMKREVTNVMNSLITGTVETLRMCTKKFPLTAEKFHYSFGLREVMGMMKSIGSLPENTTLLTALRVWVHECRSYFADRFVSTQDYEVMSESLFGIGQSLFAEIPYVREVFKEPLIVYSTPYHKFHDAKSYEEVHKYVSDALTSYNDVNPPMELVLFDQALEYVIKLRNAIQGPGGHALVVGVGGSGKRSLTKLATHLCSYELFSLRVNAQYTRGDFVQELSGLFLKCGIKKMSIVWIVNDSDIVLPCILECVHLFLTIGDISNFMSSDDRSDAESAMERQLRMEGDPEYTNRSVCWNTFLHHLQENLHIVVCSSGGSMLRTWCREFPSLVGAMRCVWFHPWPTQALLSVSASLLNTALTVPPAPGEGTTNHVSEDIITSISQHMAHVFESVGQLCTQMAFEKILIYVTPKSFLSYVQSYTDLWKVTLRKFHEQRARLWTGVCKLKETAESVAKLREALSHDQVAVQEQSAVTDQLLETVGKEKMIVQDQNAVAQGERAKTKKIVMQVNELVQECEADLAAAQPVVRAALAALQTLDRGSLTELKAMASPPPDVHSVTACVMVLTAPAGRIPRDRSWNASKKMMADVTKWMKDLLAFDPNTIPQSNVDAVKPIVNNPNFTPESIATKSVAASCLCAWVINMIKYHELRISMRPKEEALVEAQDRLHHSQIQQKRVEDKVNDLQSKLDGLLRTYMSALDDKRMLEEQTARTQLKLTLAERLVLSLGEEQQRWTNIIRNIDSNILFVVGDALLTADFFSFMGPFSASVRERLMKGWAEDVRGRAIPSRDELDPVEFTITEATTAQWYNEGLPRDRFSLENATITTTCLRWPLFIDPQLQASRWMKKHVEKLNLIVVDASNPKLHQIVEQGIRNGIPCFVENLPEDLDPSMYTLFNIEVKTRGGRKGIAMGDEMFAFDPNFAIYFHTALPNPHYRPEVHAQLTVINFTVTESGLTEQLLSTIVKSECPEAEMQRMELIYEMNDMTIELQRCEDSLLYELVNARGEILENTALINHLEKTKQSAKQIGESMERTKEATAVLSETRMTYRPVAKRGAMLYFLMASLRKVEYMYQYSLSSFQRVFDAALERAPGAQPGSSSVVDLTLNITKAVYAFVNRGLLGQHKFMFATLLTLSVLRERTESSTTSTAAVNARHLDFLVRGPLKRAGDMPLSVAEFLTEHQWYMLHALAELSPFESIVDDIVTSNQWRMWIQHEKPEQERLPGDYKALNAVLRLLVLRCLCPDRVVIALNELVESTLGHYFVQDHSGDLLKCIAEAPVATPVLFVLSSGVDPSKIVEHLGRKMKFTEEAGTLVQVSLGQGQEEAAEFALQQGQRNGAWVFLHNVHLMRKWLPKLDMMLANITEAYQGGESTTLIHPDFRIFLAAEPNESVPITLLQRCMKLVSEPPSGLQSNFVRAFHLFVSEPWETSSKQMELRTIVVAMCLFHAVVTERRRFGSLGWNRVYPFSTGDLTTSIDVLSRYLEERVKVPWEDLRFVFGEILYGGHITDTWDRRLCRTYLEIMVQPGILEGSEVIYGVQAVTGTATSHPDVLASILENFPEESPLLYGLGSVADASTRAVEGETMLRMIAETMGGGGSIGDGSGPSQATGGGTIIDLLEIVNTLNDSLPELLSITDVLERLDETRTPYQQAFLQECDRMNRLIIQVQRDVSELQASLNGQTSMTPAMTSLLYYIQVGKVPRSWIDKGYSLTVASLQGYIHLITEAHAQLLNWVSDVTTPRVVNVSYLLSPAAFLSAVVQDCALRYGNELDQMMLTCEVTRKNPESMEHVAREGCHVYGLVLQGARWDVASCTMCESRGKELFCKMPVVTVKGMLASKFDSTDMYECPVYRTTQRGEGYVAKLHLKTKEPQSKWIVSGTALVLDSTV